MRLKKELPPVVIKLMKRLCKDHIQKDVRAFDWIYGLSCSNKDEAYYVVVNERLSTVTVYYFGKNGQEIYIAYTLTQQLSFLDILEEINEAVAELQRPIPFSLSNMGLPVKIPTRLTS